MSDKNNSYMYDKLSDSVIKVAKHINSIIKKMDDGKGSLDQFYLMAMGNLGRLEHSYNEQGLVSDYDIAGVNLVEPLKATMFPNEDGQLMIMHQGTTVRPATIDDLKKTLQRIQKSLQNYELSILLGSNDPGY